MTWWALMGLGFILGLKHALEPDHLTAVTTLANQERSAWAAARTGAIWGAGHSASLLALSSLVLLLRLPVPERWVRVADFPVGIMLVILGLLALRDLGGKGGHVHLLRQGGRWRLLVHAHGPVGQAAPAGSGIRPLLVGLVHGLAGSGALIVLVTASIPAPLTALAYITAFAVGTVLSMAVCSCLLALPFRFTLERLGGWHVGLRAAAATVSVGLGVFMMWSIASGR